MCYGSGQHNNIVILELVLLRSFKSCYKMSIYEDFESLDKVEKSSYVLGSELWESKFDGLLRLVKEYIIVVWEIQKHKLYDSDSGPGQQLHSRSSPGERNGKFSQNGKFGQNGKLGHSCTNVTKGSFMAPGSVIMLLCI